MRLDFSFDPHVPFGPELNNINSLSQLASSTQY